MTELVWDKAGEHRFETGIDRGVLYLPDGSAVPWNGLVSVTEDRSRDVKSYYIDGIKYLDKHIPGSFAAKLDAFTYPDELDELIGISEFAPGVQIHDQRTRLFNLSYRTGIGNDLEGLDFGYKIHILYNILANPADVAFETLGGKAASAKPFSWQLTGTPQNVFGIRPTSHVSLDSRRIDPDLLTSIEEKLYGTTLDNPSLPSLLDLLELVGA